MGVRKFPSHFVASFTVSGEKVSIVSSDDLSLTNRQVEELICFDHHLPPTTANVQTELDLSRKFFHQMRDEYRRRVPIYDQREELIEEPFGWKSDVVRADIYRSRGRAMATEINQRRKLTGRR